MGDFSIMGCANSSTAQVVDAPAPVATESRPIAQEKVETQVQQTFVDGDNCSTAAATEASDTPSLEVTDIAEKEVASVMGIDASAAPSLEATHVAEKEAEVEIEQDVVTEANEPERIEPETNMPKVVLDEADDIRIEGEEEFALRPRGTGGCGFCAQQTDNSCSLFCGLFSCDLQSNAGLCYCRGCC